MCGAECHLRQGSDHRDAAVPCEGRGGVDSNVVQLQEHFLLGIQEGQAWGCGRCQLVEPWPLLQKAGCGAVMAEKWGVEDLENKGARPL